MYPVLSAISAVGQFTAFALRGFLAAMLAICRPAFVLRPMYSVLVGAWPLATVTGIALGAVIWMHTYSVLKRSGTEAYLPKVLGAAVLLELAPIAAGLIVAARTGASLGADIGAMKQGEQIDALEMMGLSPMRTLIGPRILACMVSLPFLDLLIAAVALGSGFVAHHLVGTTTWLAYSTACVAEVFPGEVIASTLKTGIFGFLIGAAGCYAGFQSEGGTEGVGHAATQGVVHACLLVLAADVLLVGLIRIMLS